MTGVIDESVQSSVLCASGSLGLTPFHSESFWKGIERRPDVVAADAGSGDIGPFYLGSGHWYNLREWEEQDLVTMLKGARSCGAKMIVGSAGGAGLDQAVDLYFEIVSDAIRRDKLGPLKVARIYSEVSRDWLFERLDKSSPLGAPWALTSEILDKTSRAVAMAGIEPYLKALDEGADVIIGGRSCDDVLFAAHPVWLGLDRGLSLHMGKCIECGPLGRHAASPARGRDRNRKERWIRGRALAPGYALHACIGDRPHPLRATRSILSGRPRRRGGHDRSHV